MTAHDAWCATWFGTLHGNRGWRVEGGWLDEVRPQPRRIVSYDDVRLAIADNSESADVTTELVDVGKGTRAADYAGKDVKGKLVLVSSQPEAVLPSSLSSSKPLRSVRWAVGSVRCAVRSSS